MLSRPSSGITAIFIALTVLFTATFSVQAAPPEQNGDPNAACLSCHTIPDRSVELPSGERMSVYVDRFDYHDSVHGEEGLPCVACHTDISGYPHDPITATDYRDYQLQRYEACKNCHVEQYEATQDSMHTKLLQEGNRDAAICTDCHGSHDVPSQSPSPQETSITCSLCHAAIYEQYKESVHGSALVNEDNPDVPNCVDCHGVHTIHDPTRAQFRAASPELCGECHRDEQMMGKYDISTDVFNTYVADFHGKTVTLFDKQSPDQATNKAVCYDCHGVHDIKAVNDPEAMVVKENLLVTCQRCHPDADANFPTSWTSHFIPDREHNPLVYYINIFYLILIPGMVGFMVIYVFLDAMNRFGFRPHRRPRRRGKKWGSK